MNDFTVNLGETIIINYTLPMDLTFKKVFFKFGDKYNYIKKIECKRQSVLNSEYIPWSKGGLSISLSENELDKAGDFYAQFEIYNLKDVKIIYPQKTFLTFKVRKPL